MYIPYFPIFGKGGGNVDVLVYERLKHVTRRATTVSKENIHIAYVSPSFVNLFRGRGVFIFFLERFIDLTSL